VVNSPKLNKIEHHPAAHLAVRPVLIIIIIIIRSG
jgi:hypothetical protein